MVKILWDYISILSGTSYWFIPWLKQIPNEELINKSFYEKNLLQPERVFLLNKWNYTSYLTDSQGKGRYPYTKGNSFWLILLTVCHFKDFPICVGEVSYKMCSWKFSG